MHKAMKDLINNLFRSIGLKISRLPKSAQNKTPVCDEEAFLVSTENDLSYYITPIGNYYLPSDITSDIIVSTMRRGRYFDQPIIDVAKEYISLGSTVLDIGSNFGQMSLLFSKLVGPSGIVYSFDADDFVFEVLKKNIQANQACNVKAVFGAVNDQSGQTLLFPKQDFKRFGAYGSYGIDPTALEGREVKTLTIDSLDIQDHISFMKIDVQGSDLAALRGAKETIMRHRMPIIFEFEQQFQDSFQTCFHDYVSFVHEIGYRFDRVVMDINYLILPQD